MVVKIYISGISGNKEVKKRQQRVLMILDSKSIKYEVIDITEPGKESDKDFMQNNAKSNGGTVSDPNPRSPLPPQIFNEEEYCGDYDEFDMANEVDTLEQFLKVEVPQETPLQPETEKDKAVNGDVEVDKENKSKEPSQEKEVAEVGKGDDAVPVEDSATVKDKSSSKEASPVKETTPLREETAASKEASPEKAESVKGTPKETSPEKEAESQSDEVAKEKEESPIKETKTASKENTPDKEETVNENGTISSREQSEEKEADEQNSIVERKKDNPSEVFIQSEQTAAAE